MEPMEISVFSALALAAGASWATHRLARRSQRRLAERLDFALQSGRMGTWDIDLKTRKVTCSDEMLALWGVTGKFDGDRDTLRSRVHPEDLARMNEAIERAIAEDSLYELEYRILPEPGVERWVLSRGRCTYDPPGSRTPVRLSGIVYDVTELRAKEEALRNAIQTRDQFISIAGHELKTPLTGLQLLVQLRLRDLKRDAPGAADPVRIERWLNDQQEYIRRMTHLVNDILDVSKIANGRLKLKPETFDLAEMVTDVLGRFRATADAAQVEILLEANESVRGQWDRFRLEQVVLNLLTNALRYGGRKPIRAKVKRNGERAMIAIRDEGVGIEPCDRERIFDRFERAVSENEVSGLGLGLFISNEIVRTHGGEIRVESEPGKGSEFTVCLPLSDGGSP